MKLTRRDLAFCAFVLLITLLVRLPYFYAGVLDWDESSFILMGRDILEGFLPYVRLWDNKPPGLFAFFALMQMIGHSLIALRLIGTLWFGLSAIILYRATCRLIGNRMALLAPALYICASSTLADYNADFVLSGAGLMTEHITSVPITLLLAYCIKPRWYRSDYLIIGLLLGLSGLLRTNLFFIAPAFGIVALLEPDRWLERVRRLAILGGGILLPLILTIAIYWQRNALPELYKGMIISPKFFLQEPYFFAEDGKDAFHFFGKLLWFAGYYSLHAFVWFAGTLGLIACARQKSPQQPIYQRLLMVAMFVLFSIFLTGAHYSHYLIQVLPFLALFAACLINRLHLAITNTGLRRGLTGVLVLLIFLPYLLFIQPRYSMIIQNIAKGVPPETGDEIYEIADYLKSQGAKGTSVMACDIPIINYMTHSSMPVFATHPVNLINKGIEELFKPDTEYATYSIETVLLRKPEFVVSEVYFWPCNNIMNTPAAQAAYKMVRQTSWHKIWKRQ